MPSPTLLYALGFVYGLLIIASLISIILRTRKQGSSELGQRIRSWWIIIILMTIPLLLGRLAFLVVMSFISFVALKEFVSIIPSRMADRPVIAFTYLLIPLQAIFIGLEGYGIFLVFVPVFAFLALAYLMTTYGKIEHFLPSLGTYQLALITIVYNLGYVAYIMYLPEGCNEGRGNGAIVLFLLIATQLNDVAQYVWGKSLGRRKIMPTVSPNKTWEGFIGGLLTSAAFIFVVAPLMTPMRFPDTILLAFLLPLAGFIGDVTMSAIKRDVGVKDTSTLIPGHGGALDRLDSLTFTAPLFFHLLVFSSYGPYAQSCAPV